MPTFCYATNLPSRKSSVGGKFSVLTFSLAPCKHWDDTMLTTPEDKSDMYSNDNTQLNMLVCAIKFNLPVIKSNGNIEGDILIYCNHLLGPPNNNHR